MPFVFHPEFFGWLCIATGAVGNAMLFAQGDKLPPTDWTAYGLLGTVLVSVGLFLRWYLPAREKAWEESSQQTRSDFLTALASQREADDRQRERETALLERINRDLGQRFDSVAGEIQKVTAELNNFRETWLSRGDETGGSRPPQKSASRPPVSRGSQGQGQGS